LPVSLRLMVPPSLPAQGYVRTKSGRVESGESAGISHSQPGLT
jgi:hypothetical protein